MFTELLLDQLRQAGLVFRTPEQLRQMRLVGGTTYETSRDDESGFEIGTFMDRFTIEMKGTYWIAYGDLGPVISASANTAIVVNAIVNYFAFKHEYSDRDFRIGCGILEKFGFLKVFQKPDRIALKVREHLPILDPRTDFGIFTEMLPLTDDSIFDYALTRTQGEFHLFKINGDAETLIHSAATFSDICTFVQALEKNK